MAAQKQDKLARVCLQRLSNVFEPAVRVNCLLILVIYCQSKKVHENTAGCEAHEFLHYRQNVFAKKVFDALISVNLTEMYNHQEPV